MKKHLFLTICLIVLGMSQAMAQAAKVALQHNGNVTLYNADELQKALDASVDGDTLYLNEGTFTGNVTIAKRVSVIGAGQNTTINGSVTISATGTFTARVLDALYITKEIAITGATHGLVIRKCKFQEFYPQSTITNGLIDRCYQFDGYYDPFRINASVKGLHINNSKITYISGAPENIANVTFSNCNVKYISSKALATFINCIINTGYCDNGYPGNCYYSYCLLSQSNNTINEQNCTFLSGVYNNFTSSSSELEFNTDIIGNNGTVVGINGGTTPYTLVPSVPTVTNYSLNVNTTTKRLNVNISVESK